MQIITPEESGLSEENRRGYAAFGQLPDGRICGIYRFIYTFGLLVDLHEYGYEDRYCYHHEGTALAALLAWDGTGDPVGWHRHPASGRRRDHTGREWTAP
jgi:hypothetical protein